MSKLAHTQGKTIAPSKNYVAFPNHYLTHTILKRLKAILEGKIIRLWPS